MSNCQAKGVKAPKTSDGDKVPGTCSKSSKQTQMQSDKKEKGAIGQEWERDVWAGIRANSWQAAHSFDLALVRKSAREGELCRGVTQRGCVLSVRWREYNPCVRVTVNLPVRVWLVCFSSITAYISVIHIHSSERITGMNVLTFGRKSAACNMFSYLMRYKSGIVILPSVASAFVEVRPAEIFKGLWEVIPKFCRQAIATPPRFFLRVCHDAVAQTWYQRLGRLLFELHFRNNFELSRLCVSKFFLYEVKVNATIIFSGKTGREFPAFLVDVIVV